MRRLSLMIIAALSFAAFTSVSLTASAQNNKKPNWITKAPTLKDTYVGIASVSKRSMNPDGESSDNSSVQMASSIIVSQLFFNDKYKESGKKEAQKKILGSLHLAVDANSLLGKLIMKGAYLTSFDDVFVENVLNTPLFKLQGEWEDDEEYWCYYTITEKDYQARMAAFEDSICNQAETMWKLGMSYQQEGLLYSAAKTYSQALDLVHPLIYTQHMVKHDFENVDLFMSLYNSYIHVYDDIKISCSTSEIPAVAGEAVPSTFTVKVDQKGVPVQKVGVILDYEGTTDGSLITNENGEITFSIVKATDEPQQLISFSIDKEGLYDLPESYVFSQLTERSDNFGTAEINVKLFDPTNYIYLNFNPSDSATEKAVNELISARKDLTIVKDRKNADLILDARLASLLQQQSDPKAKWPINQFSTSLLITVDEKSSGKELFNFEIKDFQYLAPTSLSREKVLHSSAKEMSRQLLREFPDNFKSFSYDKRALVWSTLK